MAQFEAKFKLSLEKEQQVVQDVKQMLTDIASRNQLILKTKVQGLDSARAAIKRLKEDVENSPNMRGNPEAQKREIANLNAMLRLLDEEEQSLGQLEQRREKILQRQIQQEEAQERQKKQAEGLLAVEKKRQEILNQQARQRAKKEAEARQRRKENDQMLSAQGETIARPKIDLQMPDATFIKQQLEKRLTKVAEATGIEIDVQADDLQTLKKQLDSLQKDLFELENPNIDATDSIAQVQKLRAQVNDYDQTLVRTDRKTRNYMKGQSLMAMNTTRIIQDAQFGMMGVTNNLEAWIEGFAIMQKRSKGFGDALKNSLTPLVKPPFNLMIAGTIFIQAIQHWDKITAAVDRFKMKLGGASEDMINFEQTLDEFRRKKYEETFESISANIASMRADEAKNELHKLTTEMEALKNERQEILNSGGLSSFDTEERSEAASRLFEIGDRIRELEPDIKSLTSRVGELGNAAANSLTKVWKQAVANQTKMSDKQRELTLEELELQHELAKAKTDEDRKEIERQLDIVDLKKEQEILSQEIAATIRSQSELSEDSIEHQQVENEIRFKAQKMSWKSLQLERLINKEYEDRNKEIKEINEISEDTLDQMRIDILPEGMDKDLKQWAKDRRDRIQELREEATTRDDEGEQIAFDAEGFAKARELAYAKFARKRSEILKEYEPKVEEPEGIDLSKALNDAEQFMERREQIDNMINENARQASEKRARLIAEGSNRQRVILEQNLARRKRESQRLFEQRVQKLKKEKNEEIISEKEFAAKKELLRKNHQARLNNITLKGEQERSKIEKKEAEKRLEQRRRMFQAYSGIVQDIGSVFGAFTKKQDEESRKQFEQRKKFMYAQAVMQAVSASIGIFEGYMNSPLPPGLREASAVAASASVLSTLTAKANKIRNMKYDSASASGGSSRTGSFTQINGAVVGNRASRLDRYRRQRERMNDINRRNARMITNEELKKLNERRDIQRVVLEDRTVVQAYDRAVEIKNKLEN